MDERWPVEGPVTSANPGNGASTSKDQGEDDLPSSVSKWVEPPPLERPDFVKFMEDKWEERVQVVKDLQELQSKVRLNPLQCNYIINVYTTLEVLTLHPTNYLDMVDVSSYQEHEVDARADQEHEVSTLYPTDYLDVVDARADEKHGSERGSDQGLQHGLEHGSQLGSEYDSEESSKHGPQHGLENIPTPFQTTDHIEKVHYIRSLLNSYISSLEDSFLELSRIMRHGKILVRECACEDWNAFVKTAATKMTIISNHSKWSTVTAFSLHVQKLQWIIDVIGNGIEEVCSFTSQIHKPWNPSLKNGFKLSRIQPPTPGTDIEKTDCESLLDDLLKYLDQPSSSGNEREEEQLARFLVWRLQTEAFPRADPPSSENADVASTPIYESFARHKMKFIRLLGHGAQCSAVYEKSWSGIKVAVKELSKEQELNFEKEIYFAELQHPHVVRVIDHWIGQCPTIVLELMDGDMDFFMKTKFKDNRPSLSWALEMMHQLAEAMKYLWDNDISHRDLKSLNLLVRGCSCNDADCVVVKLADFGTSKMSRAGIDFHSIAGTTRWMAPEVAKTGYTIVADVFSFAITCSEILTGKSPYHDKGKHERIPSVLKKGVKRGTLRPTLPPPPHCPVILSAYLRKCWASNPSHRPKHFSEICNFLLYCKEVVLRKEMPSQLPSINDNDARVLLTHLGLKSCLERDYSTGKLIHVSSLVYNRIMLAIRNGDWEELLQGHVTEAIRKEAESFVFRDDTGHGQLYIQDDAGPAHDNMMDKTETILTHLPGLVTLSAVALLSSFNEEGDLRLTATVGRLLVLSFLISRLGLVALLEYRPTFLLLGLKDFLLSSSLFIAIVLVMYTKVRTMVTGPRRRKVQVPGYESLNYESPVIHTLPKRVALFEHFLGSVPTL